ncbi:MAG: hypothetical protein HQM10_14695 [Candidatus Riflebacteria bacterium]|nr:hypothetical protein [Candidatus Riflebacteria bacterium]
MMNNISKRGIALVFALIFATILLQLAIIYSGMLKSSKPQTIMIDDQMRAEFYANGLADLAILKFQMFPGDFYAACEAASSSMSPSVLDHLTYFIQDPALTIDVDSAASSSFNITPISVKIATMTLLTQSKWNREALNIKTTIDYTDSYGKEHRKSVDKIVQINRTVVGP